MRPQAAKLANLLGSDPSLQPVIAKARDLHALHNLLLRFLPPELARQIRACNRKDDKLVILAATPAIAAKLKLLSESLRKFLLKQGLEVNSVFVRVQPDAELQRHKTPEKKAALSPAGVGALRQLHGRLRDSPAREALKALLDHQVESGSKGKP
jgi:hypothetical protein